LPNRVLLALVVMTVLLVLSHQIILPSLPDELRTPGSPALYGLGVLAAGLFAVTFSFFVHKRTGTPAPPRWYLVHVGAGCCGLLFAVVHAAGQWLTPPALMFVCLGLLVASGVYARVRVNQAMASTFGRKLSGFALSPTIDRDQIRQTIGQKIELLERLAPGASEALFSPTLRQWLRHPLLSYCYQRLIHRERLLTQAHRGLSAAQRYWRYAHIVLAALFAFGLLVHIIAVILFAGYVTDYGVIGWWHIAAW